MTTASTPTNAHNLPDPLEEIENDAISIASPRQLMWWKFRKHKIAVISVIALFIMYMLALFAGFVSPYDPNTRRPPIRPRSGHATVICTIVIP